jgi:hypothetical protein
MKRDYRRSYIMLWNGKINKKLIDIDRFNLLGEIETVVFLRDAPDSSDSAVNVHSGTANDNAESDDHQQTLKDIGDEDCFDATYRGVEGADYSEYQNTRGTG